MSIFPIEKWEYSIAAWVYQSAKKTGKSNRAPKNGDHFGRKAWSSNHRFSVVAIYCMLLFEGLDLYG